MERHEATKPFPRQDAHPSGVELSPVAPDMAPHAATPTEVGIQICQSVPRAWIFTFAAFTEGFKLNSALPVLRNS